MKTENTEQNETAVPMLSDDSKMKEDEYNKFKKNCNKKGLLSRFYEKRRMFKLDSDLIYEFKKILTSNEDYSAIISLMIRSFKLWNNRNFWRNDVNLDYVMEHYATNDQANIKNLFSILLYDWSMDKDEPGNSKKSTEYLLKEKFDAYSRYGNTIFNKLFEIIDNENYDGYQHVCLRIIYCYMQEVNLIFNDEDLQNTISKNICDSLCIKNIHYKAQILKIFTVFLKNVDETYMDIKNKILEAVKYDFKISSYYQISIDSIEQHCDEKFFRLIFLLKENCLKSFEFAFEKFIKIYQKLYGEFWKVAIKENSRLLYYTAETQCEKKLLKTVEFIFDKCPFIELNSTILTSFQEIDEFYVIFNEPLEKDEKEFLKNACDFINIYKDNNEGATVFNKKFLHNKSFSLKILLGRSKANEKNFLESLLTYPSLAEIVKEIWTKFNLFTKPEILSLKNPMRRPLIYYTLVKSQHDKQSFELTEKTKSFFELLRYPEYIKYDRPKQYMMMQNSLIYSLAGKSLIEFQVKYYLDKSNIEIFIDIVYLIGEIGILEKIKNDSVIVDILELIVKSKKNTAEMFEIDTLLGVMISYWSPGDFRKDFYQQYKNILEGSSPFYKLLFMIIEKKCDDFIRKFPENIVELESTYEKRYNLKESQKYRDISLCELYTSNFVFIFFMAALNTKQRRIIDCLFTNDSFITIEFSFSENMKAQEIHYYAALAFLKRKHEFGRSNIPKDWVTREVVEEFLNSKINYRERELIEIDFSCMIHAESQKIKVRSECDIEEKTLLMEDIKSLKYIVNSEKLKHFITHPVVETYINLKSYKYHRIFKLNYLIFLILYVLPFIILITKNHIQDKDNLNIFWRTLVRLEIGHYLGILFLIVRECFQYLTNKSAIDYLRNMSNILEITLIILSITLNICISIGIKESDLVYLEAALILFITINATSSLPSAYSSLNMEIFKRVSKTFLGVFYTFASILIAFSLSFFIIFFENNLKNGDQTNPVNQEPISNFKQLDSSILKVIIMMSGEYSIEPISLSFFELIFFAIFVMCTFIMYNLILGLSIENVQIIKHGSRRFILEMEAERLILVAEKLNKFYDYLNEAMNGDSSERSQSGNNENRIRKSMIKFAYRVLRFLLTEYIYVHNIEKVYVNKENGNVYYKIDQKYEPILRKGRKKVIKFHVSKITLEEIQEIIHAKNRSVFEDLKKKIKIEDNLP